MMRTTGVAAGVAGTTSPPDMGSVIRMGVQTVELVSTGEAARHLGVGAQAVRRWCEAGQVAGAVQLPSGRWRLPWSIVVKILGCDPRR